MSGELLTVAAERLAAALAGASLAAAALVAGCAALLFVGRRLPPRIGVALWWLVALRILLELGGVSGIALPLLPAAPAAAYLEIGSEVAGPRPSPAELERTPAERAPLAVAEQRPGLFRAHAGPLAAALVWLAGLAIVLAVEIRRGTRLAAVLRRARPVTDPRVRVACAKAAAALGLERRVPLLVSDEIATPMVVGLFRPRLVLPADAPLAGDELRLVLLHELAHVRRRDALFALVPALARRLFWFHPLVRFAEREYALATEAACDTEVLARTGAEPAQYGRLLVRFAVDDEQWSPALALSAHSLERRLRMLVSAPLAGRRLLVAAPIVLVAALGVALPVRLVAAADEPPTAPAVPSLPAESAAVPATPYAPSAPATPALPELEPGRRLSRAAVPSVPAVAPAPPAALPVAFVWSTASVPAPPAPPAAPAAPARPAPVAPPAAIPVGAVAPAAPAAPAFPAPPAPPAPPARPLWSELDRGDAFLLLDGDTSIVVNASSAERRRARELAADGEPVMLVRRRGATWVSRDRAAIAEAREWVDAAVASERERAEEMSAAAEHLRARLETQAEAQRADVDRLAESARAAAEELARQAHELAAAESERARAMAEAGTSDARSELEAARREIERRRERVERELAELETRYRERSEADRDRIEREFRQEITRSEGELHRTAGRDLDADLEALIDRLIAERRAERMPK